MVAGWVGFGVWGFIFCEALFVVFRVLHFPVSCKMGWVLDTL